MPVEWAVPIQDRKYNDAMKTVGQKERVNLCFDANENLQQRMQSVVSYQRAMFKKNSPYPRYWGAQSLPRSRCGGWNMYRRHTSAVLGLAETRNPKVICCLDGTR